MLYDILVIDDVLKEPEQLSAEEMGDAVGVRQFILKLIKDSSLRVTWTTGEVGDLEKLTGKDLSSVKSIFLDLHLEGVNDNFKYKDINSIIVGVIDTINEHIQEEEVTCYINSKYNNINYGEEGRSHLQAALKTKFGDKFTIEDWLDEKNALTEKQTGVLVKHTLKIYVKSLLINKSIDLEQTLNNKLTLSNGAEPRSGLHSSWEAFKKQYSVDETTDKALFNQVELLRVIRNAQAHSYGDMSNITDKDMKKTFWKIITDNECNEPIEFKDFDSLFKYTQSIDKLCKEIEKLPSKSVNPQSMAD